MPRLRARFPKATFTIAGRDPSKAVRALANDYVRVTGTVKDLAPLFDEHAVYLNAVNSGGGSSLKVLEPLLSGAPARRATVRGARLRSRAGHPLPRRDGFDDAIEAVGRIFNDRKAAEEIAERGRRYALKHAWSEVAKPFVKLVDQMLSAGNLGRSAAGHSAA